jgi:hypothetical protein
LSLAVSFSDFWGWLVGRYRVGFKKWWLTWAMIGRFVGFWDMILVCQV